MDSTIISLAPMEGMTGFVVRNAFCHNFPGIDRYYTPFIPAGKSLNKKYVRDISAENNSEVTLIPQLISRDADEVMHMKSIWQYLKEEYPEAGSDIKKLIKAKKLAEYKAIARGILA